MQFVRHCQMIRQPGTALIKSTRTRHPVARDVDGTTENKRSRKGSHGGHFDCRHMPTPPPLWFSKLRAARKHRSHHLLECILSSRAGRGDDGRRRLLFWLTSLILWLTRVDNCGRYGSRHGVWGENGRGREASWSFVTVCECAE